ncbi:fumarylacetoacetate hydrolase family protein [Streptomyces sp. NPDC005808]|uniref:fumarylacetoacetate hydrolase family protein n=1 Tax=Streptomyces sp. NPDC005808 TaxID=3364734 RepID=UPI0036CAA734
MRIGIIDNRLVLVDGESAVDIERASNGRISAAPAGLFDVWDTLVEWAATAAPGGERLPLDRLQFPVPPPRQVFAVGANYREHVEEAKVDLPEAPLIFTKFPSCLSGPGDAIPLPSRHVDWEVELVVVMGRRAERVAERDAWRHVAGLTVGQDISERAVQMAGPAPQFSMGKSFPGFGPMGPVLVTPDALDDPDDLEIGCTLNGRVMQKSRTSTMVHSVAELIARISAVCPLLPGDVIFTGTPGGVGALRSPSVFLKPGDTLVSWATGVGELRNPVTAGPDYSDENK